MAEEKKTIEELLGDYRIHFNKDEVQKRSDLSTTVEEVFRRGMRKFLIEKHGAKENDADMPNSYRLGSEEHDFKDAQEDAEELFNSVGMELIRYAFSGINNDDFEAIKRLYQEDPAHLAGMMQAKFGIKKEEFIQDMTENQENVFKSQNLPRFTAQAGKYLSTYKINQLGRKIFIPRHFDHVKKHAKGELESLGYNLKDNEVVLDDLPDLLQNLYTGEINEAYADRHKKIDYKMKLAEEKPAT